MMVREGMSHQEGGGKGRSGVMEGEQEGATKEATAAMKDEPERVTREEKVAMVKKQGRAVKEKQAVVVETDLVLKCMNMNDKNEIVVCCKNIVLIVNIVWDTLT